MVCDDSDVCFETEERESNCWDSDRMSRSSVSSFIVNRSSSSHSGCCPPLRVSSVLYFPSKSSCFPSLLTTSPSIQLPLSEDGRERDIPLNSFSPLLLIPNIHSTEWILFPKPRFIRQIPLLPSAHFLLLSPLMMGYGHTAFPTTTTNVPSSLKSAILLPFRY